MTKNCIMLPAINRLVRAFVKRNIRWLSVGWKDVPNVSININWFRFVVDCPSHIKIYHISSWWFVSTAKKLGEQCFYDQTCMHNDINSLCMQIRHNALCQCIPGFHSVSYLKPTKRIFCTEGQSTWEIPFPYFHISICIQ